MAKIGDLLTNWMRSGIAPSEQQMQEISLVLNSIQLNNIPSVDWPTLGEVNYGDIKKDFAAIANGVTGGNSHDHNGGDGAQIDHTTLSNIGTNTHAQIDTFVTKHTFIGARAYLSSTLGTTVDAAPTKVLLDGESYDVGGNFANYKFVAPVAGYYQVSAMIRYANGVANKTYGCLLYVNNANAATSYQQNGTGTGPTIGISDLIHLNATDYVELFYYHSDGTTTTDVTGGATATWMSIGLVQED